MDIFYLKLSKKHLARMVYVYLVLKWSENMGVLMPEE